jgi:hypothetical protein
MRRTLTAVASLPLLLPVCASAACQSPMEAVADSHVRANVPDEKEFDRLLKRDLAAYFKERKGREVSVDYELLRKGPTQTGIAFPKFYAWVKVRDKGGDGLLEEGAVRLAAVEKKSFGVTDFLKRADAERDPESAYKIFPRPVADKIREMVGK